MDVNDDFRLEEELSGSEGRRESAGGGAVLTHGRTLEQNKVRKRRREPTVKIEEKKKTGPKGKAGEGPAKVGLAAVFAR